MQTQIYTIQVNVPSVDDFGAKYKQYGPLAQGPANFLYEVLVSPESFVRAKIATILGHPAIDGPAELAYQAVANQNTVEWNDNLKRFCGAVVCCLMETNGYRKTGEKKSVRHHAFTKGEFYKSAHEPE